MKLDRIEAAIEAILFSMGDAVPIGKLAEVIEQDKETTRKIVANLMDRYQLENRGIRIIEIDHCFQMCSKPEYYEYIRKISHKTANYALTDVQVETLSIIAYKQPVTKSHIEKIRGVKTDHAVNKLVEYNLVCELGRLDAPGRPILFGTTQEFLRCFGFSSIDEIPELGAATLENVTKEVMREVDGQQSLDEMQALVPEIME